MPSPFGGLWPDAPNAVDIIRGKQEIGTIAKAQADRLRFWSPLHNQPLRKRAGSLTTPILA